MESFDENAQRAKVGAGFKGGPFNKSPITHPPMNFVQGIPGEVLAKQQHKGIQQGKVEDPWVNRRSK